MKQLGKYICLMLVFYLLFGQFALADSRPAKELFGEKAEANSAQAEVFGTYSAGCLGGGQLLPSDGEGWQVMRPKRNRHWGHPLLLDYIKDLSMAAKNIGINGILIGDMSQPRGGPMTSGHRSHQTGIDVDIWWRTAAESRFTVKERNEISSWTLVRQEDGKINEEYWNREKLELLRTAAIDERVVRIFVNPRIKLRVCSDLGEELDRSVHWLKKIRPWWGHRSHFHVRLHCPIDSLECQPQAPVPPGDGCAEAQSWIETADSKTAKEKYKPKPDLLIKDLPSQCQAVLDAH